MINDDLKLKERALQACVNGIIIADARLPDNPVIYVNDGFTRITGYAGADVVGKNCRFLQGPDTDPSALANIREALRLGRDCRVILRNYRKDGGSFWNDCVISPVLDEAGRLTHFIGVQNDITSLVESERNLAEAQRIAGLGSWSFDARTLEIAWSDEAAILAGFTPGGDTPSFEEYLSRVHPEDRKAVQEAYDSAVLGGKGYEGDHRLILPNGVVRDLHVISRSILDDGGKVVQCIGTLHDVSDRKSVERIKNEFVYTASHELRTPLTSIRGALGIVTGRMTTALPGEAVKLLNIAQSNCDRLARLLDDILELEKLNAGKPPIMLRDVELADCVHEAIAANQCFADTYGVALHGAGHFPRLTVRADPDRLFQVLANLISNAVKFSPRDGEVTLAVTTLDGKAVVSVADRGCGIPADFQPKIFGKFARADASDSRHKGGGAGLGLSITKALVERMGGSIRFLTEPGRGTTFYFDLPLAEATAVAPAGEPQRDRVGEQP